MIHSFRLEIAIASSSFASLLFYPRCQYALLLSNESSLMMTFCAELLLKTTLVLFIIYSFHFQLLFTGYNLVDSPGCIIGCCWWCEFDMKLKILHKLIQTKPTCIQKFRKICNNFWEDFLCCGLVAGTKLQLIQTQIRGALQL